MSIFGELDYRMSVVKRWGVVKTIQSQSVAEHSYNVAIVAERLARRFIPNGLLPGTMYPIFHAVVIYALHHDRPESITGDNPSYMKRWVNEEGALQSVPAYHDEEGDTSGSAGDEPWVRFFVKCADYIDACVFLRMEISLGNRSVQFHLRNLETRFKVYLEEQQTALTADAPQVFDWYAEDVVGGLFGSNGQYVSEIDGFPKS